ncbi:uncharacterized protein LOC132872843 isoform X3 [Neoarius graeffei]|uniref:uncharacterized protein LOC132872843 isoform X3 n=1 Tax=Neoarius graeffei TaxID=443677 RepID=UPI00298BDC9B|nr:uncharacterized protein LOC132872843 isoform X3 [Neoarius graeffei]
MIGFEILHVSLCVMGLLSETLCSLTVEVEAGDNATVWCQHELSDTGYIYWYKHINDSVRHLLGCKHFFGSSPSKNCIFFTESERIVMSVHGKNTSLTITAVNVSDTGLYYCSFIELDQVNFRNSTFLQVKDRNKTLSENPDRAKGSVSSVFFILNVVFGAVIVILLSVLIFIILKHRETHRGAGAEDNEDPDSDSLCYAALQFSKKKTKRSERRDENVDPHVLYSSVRQSNRQ